MKRYRVILAALAALALPGFAGAGEKSVTSSATLAAPVEEGWVDAAELADLLEAKGVITLEEQKNLTHPMGAPSIDDEAMQEYFGTPPYRNE